MEGDHSEVGKDVGHRGVLEEVEAVNTNVKSVNRFTCKIILKYKVTYCKEPYDTQNIIVFPLLYLSFILTSY